MTTVIGSGLFSLDDPYDHDRAAGPTNQRGSRFLNYCDLNRGLFTEDGTDDGPISPDPAVFAAAAWRCATSPVMSPPYLDWADLHIAGIQMQRSLHDGTLLAVIDLITPRPAELRDLRCLSGVNGWERRREYGRAFYTEPSDAAMTRRPTLLTTANLYMPLPSVLLHHPADAPDQLTVADAKAAVVNVAELVGAQLDPIIAALSGAGSKAQGRDS